MAAEEEAFPWPELLPELRVVIRHMLTASAGAMLALTCRAEFCLNFTAARNYLRTLTSMTTGEFGLVEFLREGFSHLDSYQLGKIYHPFFVTDSPVPAQKTFLVALPSGATIDVCDACNKAWHKSDINRLECGNNNWALRCHEKRSIHCCYPGCTASPSCHRHALFACLASKDPCPNSWHSCPQHMGSQVYLPPEGWTVCLACEENFICLDCMKRTLLCIKCTSEAEQAAT